VLLSELRVFFEKSLAFKRAGPFPMVKKVRPSACELEIPKMWKSLHPVINESKLKPYHYPTFAQQQESSPTVIALRSRRCHTRSRKNPELQKTGG